MEGELVIDALRWIRGRGQQRMRGPRAAIVIASALSLLTMFGSPVGVAAAAANGPCQGDPAPPNTPFYHGGSDVLWDGAAGAEGRFDSISPALCTGTAICEMAALRG